MGPQVNWKDLPADLLCRIVTSQDFPCYEKGCRRKMRSVCSDWRTGLDSIALVLKPESALVPLPLNLAQRFPSITTLHSYNISSQDWFQDLAGLPLTDLSMSMDMDDVTPANMAVLRGLPLTRLDLRGVELSQANPEQVLTDDRLKAFEGLPLVNLYLSGWTGNGRYFRRVSFTDAGLQHLRGMPLKSLTLGAGVPLTDAGFEVLRGNTTLTSLKLYRCA